MTHEFHFNQLHMARTLASAGAFALAGCIVSVMSLTSDLAVASDPAGPVAQVQVHAVDPAPVDGAAILFDIPAQALQNALDAFGAATGFSGLYSVASTAGRSSASVRGRYTPDAALRILLGNSGLVVRYTAVDAFILEPGAADAASDAAAAATATHAAYYGVLQSRVRDAFCRDSRLARGDYRLAMSFHIDAQGQIRQPALLSSTGSAVRDGIVLDTLREIRVAQAPADPSQPFTMLILPGTADCSHE
jgi:hypothetical protein